MTPVKLVTVFLENKPGQLARLTHLLATARVNIRWVNIASGDSFGVIRFLVDQPDLACRELKQHGFAVSLVEVLAVEVQDQPGGLHVVADALGQGNVNIENASGFMTHQRAVLLMEIRDLARARQLLEGRGFKLLSQEDLLKC